MKNDREIRNFDLKPEVRMDEENGDILRISGQVAVFESWSRDLGGFIEKIDRSAFNETLENNADIYALIDHEMKADSVIGRTSAGNLTLSTDEAGLNFDLTLPKTRKAKDLYENIKAGNVRSMSFGFRTLEDSWNFDREPVERTLIRVELIEVSVVLTPAYEATSVSARCFETAKKEFEEKRNSEEIRENQNQEEFAKPPLTLHLRKCRFEQNINQK